MRRIIFLLFALLASTHTMKAQEIAVKTNLVYDALLTVNLGAEAKIAPRWSVDLSGNFNAWTLDQGKKWKHWMVQPEARYWFCDAMAGHFVAAHALGGQYNVGHVDMGSLNFLGTNLKNLKDHRYQGWYGGLGVAYGYSWILSRHFNIEAELGVGWIYTKFDTFECAGCGRRVNTGRSHNYVGPTKAAINLVYVF